MVNILFPKYRWHDYLLIWRGSGALGSLNMIPTEIRLYSLQPWSQTQIIFSSSYGNNKAKCLTITKQVVPSELFQVQYVQKWHGHKQRPGMNNAFRFSGTQKNWVAAVWKLYFGKVHMHTRIHTHRQVHLEYNEFLEALQIYIALTMCLDSHISLLCTFF